jgi:hypothetical protein
MNAQLKLESQLCHYKIVQLLATYGDLSLKASLIQKLINKTLFVTCLNDHTVTQMCGKDPAAVVSAQQSGKDMLGRREMLVMIPVLYEIKSYIKARMDTLQYLLGKSIREILFLAAHAKLMNYQDTRLMESIQEYSELLKE